MKYCIDTNIIVYLLNDKFHNVRVRFGDIPQNRILIPTIVAAELFYGANKSAKKEYNLSRFRYFLSQFEIVHFDYVAAEVYGEIRVDLERKGEIIGWNDLMIAAISKANNAVLVTNNTREFSRVKDLVCEDWTN